MFDIFFCTVAIVLTGALSFAACHRATIWIKRNPDKVKLAVGYGATTWTKTKTGVSSFAVRHGATPWTKLKTSVSSFAVRHGATPWTKLKSGVASLAERLGAKKWFARTDYQLHLDESDKPMVWSIPEPALVITLSVVVCLLVMNVARLLRGDEAPLGDFTSAYILAMLAVSGWSGLRGWSKALLELQATANIGEHQQ